MASVQAQQHKERMGKAYAAMDKLFKAPRKLVTTILINLLKAYDNEWDFIEAENYRVLADMYFDQQDTEKSSKGGGGGRVTRARRANIGVEKADNSDDSYSPPRESSPPPRTPPSTTRTPRSNALVTVKVEADSQGSAFTETVAFAKDYHSGASVRTRAATQNSPLLLGSSLGGRGRVVPNEKDKGKSPIVPESRQLVQRNPRGGRGHPNPNHTAVSSALPAPEGIEKVAFERVDGIIIPAVKRPQNPSENGTVLPSKQADQLPPLTSRVKIEGETADQPRSPGNQDQLDEVLPPTPIPEENPTRVLSVYVQTEPQDVIVQVQTVHQKAVVHVQTEPRKDVANVQIEPQEACVNPPDNGRHICEDVSLEKCGQNELSSEVVDEPAPTSLEIVPYVSSFSDGPSTAAEQPPVAAPESSVDEAPKVEVGEQGNAVLPQNNTQDGDALLLSLVDYEDDDPLEPTEQPTPGAGCDVLIPDGASDQLEPRELNEAEIRPNFIVSGSKRDTTLDAQAAVQPKRQKCEQSACPQLEDKDAMNLEDEVVKKLEEKDAKNLEDKDVKKMGDKDVKNLEDKVAVQTSTAPPRRRLIVPQSPPRDPVLNEENDDCTILSSTGPSTTTGATTGVKRKLIISASPSPEKSASTIAKNGDKKKVVADPCVKPEARGQGNTNSGLKRVKLEAGVEDLNAQQLKHDPNDISRGTERVRIPFVNEFTSESISHRFNYIPTNVVYQDAYINNSLARISDEFFCLDCAGDCLRDPLLCPCTRETGGEFAYTKDGLLKPGIIQYELDSTQDLDIKNTKYVYCASGWHCPIERSKNAEQPDKCKGHVERKFLKECWHKCGCSMLCGNRVVQRGICRKLQVFFTNDGKGWGLRTAEDLPAGAFVCEYVGEVITNTELDERNQESKRRQTDQKDTYPVLLDGDWCSESGLKDEEALCLDATRYGNVARFINHRCLDANLIDIPVQIDTVDRHYYHVAFFTCRDVQAGEELTWDYKIDFDDKEHPIEAFQCLCSSEFCRGQSLAKKRK